MLIRPKFSTGCSKLKNLRATAFYEMKQKGPQTAQNETLKLYINCIGTADFYVLKEKLGYHKDTVYLDRNMFGCSLHVDCWLDLPVQLSFILVFNNSTTFPSRLSEGQECNLGIWILRI